MASGGSVLVEKSTHFPLLEGSNPAVDAAENFPK
jgi:hypothetical protein